MLALTRKQGQKVYVTVNGVRAEVVVVGIGRGRVTLGFSGPGEVTFLRDDAKPQRTVALSGSRSCPP